MRWAVTLLAAFVVGALAWVVTAWPYRQDAGVAATLAVAAAGAVVAVLSRWATADRPVTADHTVVRTSPGVVVR